jgi:acetyl-CoA/propionyl-CoA carboxylase biotin carboxyl carrier protein
VLPGTPKPVTDPASIAAFAERHGFPIAIKATHGGGGRGMRVARDIASAAELLASAMRESAAAFGHDGCFLESYVERARHVEVQVLADEYRQVAVIGSRDCSVQRRFQKLIEEAPAPFLSGQQREDLARAANAICQAVGYVNAGTVEFLLSPSGEIVFLEVNARLQVEHTVTEETSGIDIVRAQLLLAAGQPLDAVPGVSACAAGSGGRHSIQVRINSEDPEAGFMPTTGTLTEFLPPTGPGVRVDAGVRAGSQISGQFDSLLAKLVVTGHSRTEAIERARRALGEFEIAGLPTTAPFLVAVLNEPVFAAATAGQFGVHTRWVEEDYLAALNDRPAGREAMADRTVAVRIGTRWLTVDVPGLTRAADGPLAAARRQALEARSREHGTHGAETLISPMQGTVSRVTVAEGQRVAVGQVLIHVEAMKMENPVTAPRAGVVTALRVAAGDVVAEGTILCRVMAEGAE